MKKTLLITCILTTFLTLISPSAQAINIWDEQDLQTENMGIISLKATLQDDDILKLTVECKDIIKSVIGIAFHIKYESAKLKFIKYTPGNFLETGGDPYYLVQNQELNGKIIFGETLRASDSFPSGNGEVAHLYFQIINPTQFSFEFESGVLSTLDIVRQDLDQITWENLFTTKETLDLSSFALNSNTTESDIIQTKNHWLAFTIYLAMFLILSLSSLSLIIVYLKKYRNKKLYQ